jgi:hypothetical protein
MDNGLPAPPGWTERVEAAAARYGPSVSAYIGLAVTKQMEQDAQQAPLPRRRRRKD